MGIEEFQAWVRGGWVAKPGTNELAVMALGLAGEAGETVELIKKELRGDGPLNREKLLLELGDVLHYLCRIASQYDIAIEDVMAANVTKIESRRGKRAFEIKECV
jgi:NTP pyrophosphatase (non-canonical NTP hydrolase)